MCYNLYGDRMRDLIKIVFLFALVLLVYAFRENIIFMIYDKVIYRKEVLSYNEYYSSNDYAFFQNTDVEEVKDKQELLNVLYTTVNSGDDLYSFYCKYDNCTDDVKEMLNDKDFLPLINNFVHPYNSFETINVNITAYDRITVMTKKVYSEAEIEVINNYIEDYIKNNINDSMSDYDKIKAFHDHIITLYSYDEDKGYKSYSAYTLITQGKAICGGYSDLMAIYLNRLGIKNYKISSNTHIWNFVYLNGKWYHLDATWDDPVASDGKAHLLHNFFMINTQELYNLDSKEHNFDFNIYKEAQ